MTRFNPNRHYDELIAEALAGRFPIAGTPNRADQARAVHILAERGLETSEIAVRLRMPERQVDRLKLAEVEPMQEWTDQPVGDHGMCPAGLHEMTLDNCYFTPRKLTWTPICRQCRNDRSNAVRARKKREIEQLNEERRRQANGVQTGMSRV